MRDYATCHSIHVACHPQWRSKGMPRKQWYRNFVSDVGRPYAKSLPGRAMALAKARMNAQMRRQPSKYRNIGYGMEWNGMVDACIWYACMYVCMDMHHTYI